MTSSFVCATLNLGRKKSTGTEPSPTVDITVPKIPWNGQMFLVPETRKFHRKRGSYFFCLVPRVAVWYRLSGTPFCSFTSVIMTSQRKAQRFPRRQRVAVTLKRTLTACFSLKCISQRGTRKIITSQC